MKNLDIEVITFDELVKYWKDVNHFQDPNKRYTEIIKTLGPYKTKFKDPKRIAYGLFDGMDLIGVTQLVQWNDDIVRYRTINIREEYRGQDLGWKLLEEAWYRDWSDNKYLFGWVKDTHYNWSIFHGFKEVDGIWKDDHIAVTKDMTCI